MKCLTPTLALISIASGAAADPAGLRLSELEVPHHNATTAIATWYPNAAEGAEFTYAENPVFVGVQARKDAPVAEGKHPVILFSHGMGGTDRAQAWLASELASRGAIVVLVNHPGSTWGDFDMVKGVKHWTRASDLSTALDALAADPDFSDKIDPTRVMAAGFSYGGWTALSMGGVTGNHAGIVAACGRFADTMEACDVLMSDEVSLQSIDPDQWNASYADARVTHVAAIDPGFVWGLTAENTAGLVSQTLMVGFGGAQDRMLATDFDKSGLADLMPEAQIVRLEPAYHFSAMPLCTDMGAMILEEEKDDPVCTGPEGAIRSDIHDTIVELISKQLGL